MNGPVNSSIKTHLPTRLLLRPLLEPAVRLYRRFRPSATHLDANSYDRLFDNIVGGTIVVKVPEFGIFEMNCRSHILRRILLTREYEPHVADALRKYTDPNKDALDIGANVGLFTIFMASLLSETGRVLAIEPTPGALGHLKKNIEANNCTAKVTLFEGAAVESSGEFVLNVVDDLEEYSSRLKIVMPGLNNRAQHQIRVSGETIDSLVEYQKLKPGIMKIDTEGAELQVLRGAKNTVLSHRPVILCETWPEEMLSEAGGSPGGVVEFLAECQYSICECGPHEIVAIPTERVK